jgi:hypothetical protein
MNDVVVQTPCWSFDSAAVHLQYLTPPPDDNNDTIVPDMVRHPSSPFLVSIREHENDDQNDITPQLFEAAAHYLQRIAPLAALALSGSVTPPHAQFDFGWLPLAWDEPSAGANEDARASFWVRRSNAGSTERIAILLAGNRLASGGHILGIGGSVGLRVVLHVGKPAQGRSLVRITGFSASNLHLALVDCVPQVTNTLNRVSREKSDPKQRPTENPFNLESFLRLLSRNIKTAFGFDLPPSLSDLHFNAQRGAPWRFMGKGVRQGLTAPRVFSYTATLDSATLKVLVHENIVELVTHMNLVEVLPMEPASQGPAPLMAQRRTTRSEHKLNPFRSATTLLPAAVAGKRLLEHPFVKVLPARVGNELLPAQASPHVVPEGNPKLRSDDLSAIHAFVRGQELLQRFEAYGLVPERYFRMAQLPLLMQHRASFASASNGEATNAQVSPDSQGQSLFEHFDATARAHLRVSFGSTNLSHRDMLPNHTGQPRAQPMGMAADPRWAWHEFGHVLNFASTGELEFRFAHSAGDALAAIVSDPYTQLNAPWHLRHLTFPWAMLTRSHGRPANLGWCWCGRRSRLRLLAAQGVTPPMPGGYWEEQLMSSSLFRLYCAVGGDTHGDPQRRAGASDYCVYLIMQAISLLGSANVVPARSADEFVSTLIDADIGTDHWQVKATWPEGKTRPLHRRGGALHKVIRWAFERQGLYATPDASEIIEGPGLAPPVDIHIPGRGLREAGGYDPVELLWSHTMPMPWHAHADSIFTNASPLVKVKVANRGSQTASHVNVRVWASPADGSALAWQPLLVAGCVDQDISGNGGTTTFSFKGEDTAGMALTGDYFVLAAATCPADPANADPATELPCADNGQASHWTDPTLLTDLVANDNNMGLRMVRFV